MAKLGEVCIQITDGSHNPPSGVEQSEYLMLSSKNIDDDFITLDSPRFLSHSDYIAENKRTTVSEGDLLMTIVGTIGRVAIVPAGLNGICLQRSVAVIKPNKEIINNRYLMYQLQNMRSFLEKEARGVAQKGIYLKQVSQLDIKLPELEQQKQIVKVLDKVTELISLRKQQLTKLDELVKARFVEMFGELHKTKYNIKTLDELCEFIKDGTHQTPTYVDVTEGYKFLSSKDVTSGYIDWSSIKYISEELHQELYKRIAPQRGDILLAKNGTTGIPAIVETDETFDIYVSLALLRLKPNNNVRYIWSALRMPETKTQFDNSLKGVGVPNLHLGEIKKTKIIVPPFSLQNQFATFVEHVDKQKQTMQQSLEKLELMKKALMQEYFG